MKSTQSPWPSPYFGANQDPLSLVPEALKHLLPGFLERRQRDVVELIGCMITQDFRTIKDIGHRLKGTGLAYGFPAITEIGCELEASASTADTERIQKAIDHLSAVTKEIYKSLRLG